MDPGNVGLDFVDLDLVPDLWHLEVPPDDDDDIVDLDLPAVEFSGGVAGRLGSSLLRYEFAGAVAPEAGAGAEALGAHAGAAAPDAHAGAVAPDAHAGAVAPDAVAGAAALDAVAGAVAPDTSSPFDRLAAAWNSGQRQLGNFVAGSGRSTTKDESGRSFHPNTQATEAMLRIAFLRKPPRKLSEMGQSVRAYEEGQSLVWEAMRSGQAAAMEAFVAESRDAFFRGDPRGWFFCSRRFDETSMYLVVPGSVRDKWLAWTLEGLKADRFLLPADREQLRVVLASASRGLVHVLTQRTVVRWNGGPRNLFVVPPAIIQRTSASNIRACLESVQWAGLPHLLAEVAPFCRFVLYHLSMDCASSNERLAKEYIELCSASPNVGLMISFCNAHALGKTCQQAPGVRDIIGSLHQWANLMKSFEYRDKWLASMALAIRASGPAIVPETAGVQGGLSDQCVRSTRRILGMTLGRQAHIAGERPEPTFFGPELPAGELPGPLASDLVRLWHIDRQDFKRLRHVCGGAACPCKTAEGSVGHQLTVAFLAAIMSLLPERSPELGRWQTTSDALACMVLAILFGTVGPAGWANAWPGSIADVLTLANDPADNNFARENTRRLSGVSRFLSDESKLIQCCFLNVAMMPTDWLMRRLDHLDSVAVSRCRRSSPGVDAPEPLIFQLLSEDSPVRLALRCFGNMCTPDGHLAFLVDLWRHRSGTGPEWWAYWSLRALVIAAHQAANIEYRLAVPLGQYPTRLWEVPAAIRRAGGDRKAAAVARAAEKLFGNPCRDCLDRHLTTKVVDRVGCARGFLDSVELDCLEQNALDMVSLNLDLERLQASGGPYISSIGIRSGGGEPHGA